MNSQDKDSLAAAYYVLGITDAQTRQQLDKRLDEISLWKFCAGKKHSVLPT